MSLTMATVPGAGGKIVTNRRRQRLAVTPYDRPPLPPPSRSPNWLTGVLIPSARALASGAGKVLSAAIFSDSESSSSEDLNSDSDDDIDNVNEHESPDDQVNLLNEEKMTSSEMVQHGRESQLTVQRTETKLLIERLIMQENFSREEGDRLIKVLNSRVMDWSPEAVGRTSPLNHPGQTVDNEDVEVSTEAVLEAKKWFQEKKAGSSSVAELVHGTCNLNSTAFDHVMQIESVVGSPVDMARSYMRDRPPWASPTENGELRTPLKKTMKLFNEGTPYSANHDLLSSAKRRNSLASGSWNIQDELRRVRSKAIDDMLRTSPAKINSSLFAAAPAREQFAGTGKVVSVVGERIFGSNSFRKTKPIDALMNVGVSSDPAPVVLALSALDSRYDDKASGAPSSNPDASVSGNNEGPEAIPADGEYAPSKFPYPTSSSHAGEQHSDPHSTKINIPSGTDAAEIGRLYINGFSSSQARSSPGEGTVLKNKKHDEEKCTDDTVDENRETNITNAEGNCELLSEAYMDVAIVNESNTIASDSQISLDVDYEDSTEGRLEPRTARQQGKKPGKTSRRGRGSRR